MKRGKALLAIFSAGLLLTACGNPSKKGVEYLEKGEYDQAVEQFEQAIEKNKNTRRCLERNRHCEMGTERL